MDSERIAFSRPFYGEQEARAVSDVARSGWIVAGPRVQEFERRFALQCNASHAVAVTSWTTGAFLVLRAWGIGPGDEVIVPSLTFIASVNVAAHVGATPVFVDVDPATWNIDPADVARKITPRTKVIIPIDQLGMPCDIDAINAIANTHGLRVLDDAACGFGSVNRGRPIGSLCECTVFSLHARKVITTGEGGMIVTDDAAFADRLRRLRHQGMSLSDFARHNASPTTFETYPEIGYNFRLTDLQGALGIAQLDRLSVILARRRRLAERYNGHLQNHRLVSPPFVPAGLEPNWQSYQVRLRPGVRQSRNEIMELLWAANIPTRRGVMASHHEPPYAEGAPDLPVTDAVTESTFQLPMHPDLTEAQQDRVLSALNSIVA